MFLKAFMFFTLASTLATASPSKKTNYYKIKQAHITEVSSFDPFASSNFNYLNQSIPLTPLNNFNAGVSTAINLVRLGKALWSIVENNKPVVNTKFDNISVVPPGISKPGQLSNWSQAYVRSFQVVYENGFGMEVVSFIYRLVFTHSGSLDGKGKYLANVGIYPAHLKVAWGFQFDAKTFVPNVINTGTKQKPVAGLEMHLSYRVRTPINDEQNVTSFFVSGNGQARIYQ